jgi:hypothetical protein
MEYNSNNFAGEHHEKNIFKAAAAKGGGGGGGCNENKVHSFSLSDYESD